MKARIVLAVAGLFAGVDSLAAHSGHGEPGSGNGIAHFLTEPEHVVAIVAAVAAVGVFAAWSRQRRRQKVRG